MADERLLPPGIRDERFRALLALLDRWDDIDLLPLLANRVDTAALATTQAQWTAGDHEWLAAKPEMKKALARMKARHDWIVAGRSEAGEPV